MGQADEMELQSTFTWARSGVYANYNRILGHYQAKACLEHARGDRLLDIPCGDGTLTEMLCGHFRRTVGVDASSARVAEARRRLPNAEFHVGLLEEFDTAERFDTLTMINVLEHVVDPVLAVQKASRLLASDGILIAHVPNAYAVSRKIAVLMGTLTTCEELSPFDIQVAGHRRSYSLASLCEDVRKAGLTVVNTGGVFYKMLSTPQMDWFLANGLWKEGGFGWGRVGAENEKDWKATFCEACYEYGKLYPEDCNVIYACATLPTAGRDG